MISPFKSVLGAAAVLAALATTATAQGRGGMAACRLDLATFCQGVEAGGGKKVACLTQNADKLSPECRAAMEQRQATRMERKDARLAQQAPAPQAQPPATGGGVPAVPQSAPATPSAAQPGVAAAPSPDKANPSGARAKGERPMAACRLDMQTYCATIVGGGGRKIACLYENQDKVSPACRAVLAERPLGVRARAKVETGAPSPQVAPSSAPSQPPAPAPALVPAEPPKQ